MLPPRQPTCPSPPPPPRFYYQCLMGPNARSVSTALRKVKDLPYEIIANGHGPLLRYNVPELVGRCAERLLRLEARQGGGW